MDLITGILAAAVIFAILVVTHEGGHFVAAKAVGIKVNEFAIGMGPLIFTRQKGETRYSLRLLPIGGYVAMEGEDKESDDSRAFNNKPAWAKALVAAAGPFMNFVLAIIIFAAIITYGGTAVDPALSEVIEGYPAYTAGIREGDIVTAVDGVTYDDSYEMALSISKAGEKAQSIVITVKDAETGEISDHTLTFTEDDDGRKVLGMMFGLKHNPMSGLVQGVQTAVEIETEMIKVLADLFTGNGSANDLMGPVGIVTVVDESADAGIGSLVYLTALLSLNLGLINILPFPALDGGRLLFVIIRKFAGKAISDQLEGKIHFIGIMILMILMLLITFKDINTFIMK